VSSCGDVAKSFFPDATGPVTATDLAGMTGKATSALSAHAPNLLFVKGINYAQTGPRSCGHAEGLCQSLTGVAPGSSGSGAYSGGISADMAIAKALGGSDPINLYGGSKEYIAERISFKGAGAGQVRGADVNPYLLYSRIVGLASTSPTTGMTTVDPVAAELLNTRRSVNDLVRAELKSLMGLSVLSSTDKQNLQQHFDSIREMEVQMGAMGAACSKDGLDTAKFDSLKTGFAFKRDGMIEDVLRMHMQLCALAFACNYNRVAAIQHGDGTDSTVYNVPSNNGMGWTIHQLSHRVRSDSATGSNPTAEKAQAEVDALRLKTVATGLDAFKARGLFDKSFVLWTNHIADGPSHGMTGVPVIIAGNGGGFLKQGVFVDAAKTVNNKLLNTLIAAAVRDKVATPPTLGGAGMLDAIMA
jgi:hypothetical protein